MNGKNACILVCVVILVVVIFLVIKNKNCPCSSGKEGFESGSSGLSNMVMAELRKSEAEITNKLNDLENRLSQLESK